MAANDATMSCEEAGAFDLVYRAIDGGGTLAFPCDGLGQVDLDALGELDLADYLLARTLVGRRFHRAVVRPHG